MYAMYNCTNTQIHTYTITSTLKLTIIALQGIPSGVVAEKYAISHTHTLKRQSFCSAYKFGKSQKTSWNGKKLPL